MRRADREVTDRQEILDIMRRCDVCRLAFNDGEYPYIVPLNFGIRETEDGIMLVFHSALEGHKADLMRADGRAAFEMDCRHELQYFPAQGRCTMAYESVMGRGHIRIFGDEEKMQALQELMDQYHPGKGASFNTAAVPRTLVYGLVVESMTAKRNKPKEMPANAAPHKA